MKIRKKDSNIEYPFSSPESDTITTFNILQKDLMSSLENIDYSENRYEHRSP
jgi:hypothetical protein